MDQLHGWTPAFILAHDGKVEQAVRTLYWFGRPPSGTMVNFSAILAK
jgi:hypothetical protein